jgi:hypothetical protein
MSRTYAKLKEFIGNYFYYRRKRNSPKEAWHLASMTIPTKRFRY